MSNPSRKLIELTAANDGVGPISVPTRAGGGSGGGGYDKRMEERVAALEDGQKDILSKLDSIVTSIADARLESERRLGAIEGRLIGIEAKLDSKAAKTDLTPVEVKLASVDGRVTNIPTFWQTFFLILGAIVTTVGAVAGLGVTFAKFLKP